MTLIIKKLFFNSKENKNHLDIKMKLPYKHHEIKSFKRIETNNIVFLIFYTKNHVLFTVAGEKAKESLCFQDKLITIAGKVQRYEVRWMNSRNLEKMFEPNFRASVREGTEEIGNIINPSDLEIGLTRNLVEPFGHEGKIKTVNFLTTRFTKLFHPDFREENAPKTLEECMTQFNPEIKYIEKDHCEEESYYGLGKLHIDGKIEQYRKRKIIGVGLYLKESDTKSCYYAVENFVRTISDKNNHGSKIKYYNKKTKHISNEVKGILCLERDVVEQIINTGKPIDNYCVPLCVTKDDNDYPHLERSVKMTNLDISLPTKFIYYKLFMEG